MIEGWVKLLKGSELTETEKKRAEICGSCPHIRILGLLSHKINSCKKCGCIILAKIREPHQKCPLDKW